MDNYRCSEILQDPNTFGAASGLHAIRVTRSQTKSEFVQCALGEEAAISWIDEAEASPVGSFQLAILITLNEKRVKDNHTLLPIYLQRSTFLNLIQQCHIPESYLSAIATRSAKWTTFDHDHWHGIIFHGLYNVRLHYSLAVAYNHQERRAYAIVHGLQEPFISEFAQRIESAAKLIHIPVFLPCILVDMRVRHMEIYIGEKRQQIYAIEGKTGVYGSTSLRIKASSNHSSSGRSVDLRNIAAELTGTRSELAWCQYACSVYIQKLQFLKEQLLLWQVGEPKTSNAMAASTVAKLGSEMSQKIDSLQVCFETSVHHTKYLCARADAQVQMMYSLIAHQSNEISHEIAQTALHDNQIMQSIAEESKSATKAAARDSSTMRIIAVVTILFLPATFTATLFSTSFFDFQAQKGQSMVSSWIWLYWMLTAVLTVIIQAYWYIMSARHCRLIDSPHHKSST